MSAKKRVRKEKSQYQKDLRKYRNASTRHVLVLEADLTEDQKRRLFHDSEILRKIGNSLSGFMQKNITQLFRTKRYRYLLKQYGEIKEVLDKISDPESEKYHQTEKALKDISSAMKEMQEQYNVTFDYCRAKAAEISKQYKINSIFVLTRAEDIWSGIEKILYKRAKKIHFLKYNEHPVIRAKQKNRGIIINAGGDKLHFSYNGITFSHKSGDRFISDEAAAILQYLRDAQRADAEAVKNYLSGRLVGTYRPCYASIVCEEIRGKLRVYIHVTVEGTALPKYRKDGSLRHVYGTGKIASDIGTQSYAWTSSNEIGLDNLAERGLNYRKQERKERILLQKMDRSRRANNPGNYNEDGTVKKRSERQPWKKSKRYRKLQKQHAEMCRKCAINRKLALNETVNILRSKGDTLITEKQSWKGLQKRAKKEAPLKLQTENSAQTKDGEKVVKAKRRKRFGKSIRIRCPGYFQARLKFVFENTGGKYVEVPRDYRASQFDHTSGEYKRKPLSKRMFTLSNGVVVQRDWYSSFLLYCCTTDFEKINRKRCKSEFPQMLKRHNNMIEDIKSSGKKIFNSGIKV